MSSTSALSRVSFSFPQRTIVDAAAEQPVALDTVERAKTLLETPPHPGPGRYEAGRIKQLQQVRSLLPVQCTSAEQKAEVQYLDARALLQLLALDKTADMESGVAVAAELLVDAAKHTDNSTLLMQICRQAEYGIIHAPEPMLCSHTHKWLNIDTRKIECSAEVGALLTQAGLRA